MEALTGRTAAPAVQPQTAAARCLLASGAPAAQASPQVRVPAFSLNPKPCRCHAAAAQACSSRNVGIEGELQPFTLQCCGRMHLQQRQGGLVTNMHCM